MSIRSSSYSLRADRKAAADDDGSDDHGAASPCVCSFKNGRFRVDVVSVGIGVVVADSRLGLDGRQTKAICRLGGNVSRQEDRLSRQRMNSTTSRFLSLSRTYTQPIALSDLADGSVRLLCCVGPFLSLSLSLSLLLSLER